MRKAILPCWHYRLSRCQPRLAQAGTGPQADRGREDLDQAQRRQELRHERSACEPRRDRDPAEAGRKRLDRPAVPDHPGQGHPDNQQRSRNRRPRRVGHVGGLKLVNGDKSVLVRNLILVANLTSGTPDASKLTARIAGKRVDLATVTLGTITVAAGKATVPLTAISLTADAATALNTALGTTLASGASLGTATTTARVVGKGKA